KADNLFPHQMEIRRPVPLEKFRIVRVPQGGYIIGERIQPDVDHMFTVKGDRDPPGKGGPGNTEIFQTGTEEIIDHLIFPRYRLDELGMGLDMFQEPVGVFGEAEKITLFVEELNLPLAIGAPALYQLPFQPEGLAGGTVPAFVFALVNIPLFVKAVKDRLDPFNVPFLGGPDKIVITDLQELPEGLNPLDNP